MKKNSLWLMMIALVACSNEPADEGNSSKFIKNATGTHTVAGVEHVVDATTGNISIAGVETYYFVSVDATETKAIYSVTKDNPTEYLGARILVGTPAIFTIYLSGKVDFWTTPEEVAIINANEVGRSATDYFVKTFRTVTINLDNVTPTPIEYNVNVFTGHLTTTDAPNTIVYHYVGEAGAGQAYFRNADKTFIGVAVVNGASKTYMEKRTTPWATKDEVIFSVDHEVGARDIFVQNNTKVIVTTLPNTKTTYDVDPINGDLKTGQVVVHTYQGYDSDTKAYFKNEATSEFFGIEQITANTTYKTYINKRGVAPAWTTKDDVKFTIAHEVGGAALALGMQWEQVSTSPGGAKDAFAALSFGDTAWLVGGGDNSIYTSSDRGTTWTTITAIGLADHVNNTGVALAANKLFVATPKDVYVSIDGGTNWKSVYTIPTPSTEGFKAVHVTDTADTINVPNGIYLIGKTTMVHSDENGENWTETVMAPAYLHKEIFGMGVAVHKSTFYVFGSYQSPQTSKSTDGGKTWTVITSNFPAGRDRMTMVSAPDFIYHAGWTSANDVWRTPADEPDLNAWELLAEDAYTLRNTAALLYFPADANNKENLLLVGGRGGNTVWRAEVK